MSFIDKPELKTGFWLGLGFLLALLVLGIIRALFYRATAGRQRNG